MAEIIPAVLPTDYNDLAGHISRVRGLSKYVQIDICDGKFVPRKSWPYEGDKEHDFDAIKNEEKGLPGWESVDFELDLMIRHPNEVIHDWVKTGAKRLIIHIESLPDPLALIMELKTTYGSLRTSEYGIEVGIALNIATPNEQAYELLSHTDNDGYTLVDFVQFMGIREIGFQGQDFDSAVLEKISDMRDHYPELPISVDGGVDGDSAADLVDAGATRLVSGSYIFESADITQAIYDLENS